MHFQSIPRRDRIGYVLIYPFCSTDMDKGSDPVPEPSIQRETPRRMQTYVKTKPPKQRLPLPGIPGQGELLLLFIALSYVILGFLKATKLVEIEPPVIASFLLAGLFFALSDLVRIGFRSGPPIKWLCVFIYVVSLAGCALCMIVVPIAYKDVGWLNAAVVPLGDLSVLSGMGIIIAVLVLNNIWIRRIWADSEKTLEKARENARDKTLDQASDQTRDASFEENLATSSRGRDGRR